MNEALSQVLIAIAMLCEPSGQDNRIYRQECQDRVIRCAFVDTPGFDSGKPHTVAKCYLKRKDLK